MGEIIPLHRAAFSGDVAKVRQLLGEGEYTVNCINSRGYTPLHYACLRGHLDTAGMLISEFQADMTIQGKAGTTALMLAAATGHDNVVNGLLSKYKCPLDETLLHIACRKGNTSLVRALVLEHKADHSARDDKNNTPLHVAALRGKEE